MNYELTASTLNYVRQHADDDVRLLALRGSKDPDVDLTRALQQIQGRQTARQKLPSWAANDAIVYPPHLNMEQCSSEATARYKAAICKRLINNHPTSPSNHSPNDPSNDSPSSPSNHSPNDPSNYPLSSFLSPLSSLTDLTGGFGVDFAFMSTAFDRATYVELNPGLFAIATANFAAIGLTNVTAHNADAVSILETMPSRETADGSSCAPKASRPQPISLIFLDPARRDTHGARTYAISDCTPDVLALLPTLLAKGDYVLLKLSPMLDWRKALSDLGPQHVSEIHILAVNNECKELLFLLQQQADALTVFCVNDAQTFAFTPTLAPPSPSSPSSSEPSSVRRDSVAPSSPSSPSSPVPSPSSFLYEPNAALMKAGCFAELAARYALAPLAPNSHLFLSPTLLPTFPGRRFRLDAVTTMNKRDLRQHLAAVSRANITTRNFPLSVADLRKRLKLSEGGSTYIFATTLANGQHVLLVCSPCP